MSEELIAVKSEGLPPFAWMDVRIIQRYSQTLEAQGLGVYIYLARYRDRQNECWPSLKTIERDLNLSRKTLKKYLKRLVDCGVLKINTAEFRRQGKRWQGYVFTLLDLKDEDLQGANSDGCENLPPMNTCAPEQTCHGYEILPGDGYEILPLEQDLEEEQDLETQNTRAREEDNPLVCEEECEAESLGEVQEPEAIPEPVPEPQPAPALSPCPYDPAFPCEHQQDVAEVIAPVVGNYVRVKASDVPHEVAHAWTLPDITTLYDWLTQVKAPQDPGWWRLRNAFSPKHRDDHLCMAKEWAAKRDAKRSAAVCPHPPSKIGYNPMLAQYHCFGCFQDVPVEVAEARGCDEHLELDPKGS